ncbi:MAG: hypothetical protein V5A30_00005 [Haloarculaceae archaeon]
MSKQLHDEARRERSRRTQVKSRAEEELVNDFGGYVARSDYENRVEALRQAMRRSLGAAQGVIKLSTYSVIFIA